MATEFDKRMKAYECVSRQYLTRRVPVAIRVDGKAFHTFTRGFQKPFDEVLSNAMQATMMKMCRQIQGCVFAYTQSDEITFILIDYQKLNSDGWLIIVLIRCVALQRVWLPWSSIRLLVLLFMDLR